jgi:Flp pilus assembly protein TadG
MNGLLGARRLVRHEGAATLVEFALVVPVLMLLLLGVLDFGRAVSAYVTVSNASREGLRYAALHPAATAEPSIRDAVLSRSVPLDTGRVTVRASYSNDGGNTWVDWSTPGTVKANQTSIRVEVTYPWSAATALIGRFFGPDGSASFHTSATGLAQLNR